MLFRNTGDGYRMEQQQLHLRTLKSAPAGQNKTAPSYFSHPKLKQRKGGGKGAKVSCFYNRIHYDTRHGV